MISGNYHTHSRYDDGRGEPEEYVAAALRKVDAAALEMGISGAHPCMALSFLSLSVIPSLKLTDQGYVDLSRGGLQELFVD